MKTKLLFVLLCSTFILTAQTPRELADKYLEYRGELVFTFTANNLNEVRELANIISYDHSQDRTNPLIIKAIANKKNFPKFLTYNLKYEVNIVENEPKDVVMFNPKIHKKGNSAKNAAYTLTFPLSTYPTYADYAQQMADFASDHSAIAELIDIGGTVQGVGGGDKRLLFIKLSKNVSTREAEPRVMYTSSMHGDEIAGYPSMLNLIDYFITAYEDVGHSDHARIKLLLDTSEVWINPLANPDATYWLDNTNTSVSQSRRANANGIDLNRNYPAPGTSTPVQGGSFQIETVAFMDLAESTHFVLAANFHGGEEVVNYPWDYTYDRHPDDTWWQLISTEYAANAQNDSPINYEDTYNENRGFTNFGYMDFDNGLNSFPGITHGADWYLIAGGRQDYMNYDMQCREVTFEISSTKTPPTSNTSNTDEVIDFWNYNQEAYIEFLIQGTYGFQGIVKDAISGEPIKAKITLIESSVVHDALGSWVETELPLGDFYRPIEAGTYDILIEAECFAPVTLSSQSISNYQTVVLDNSPGADDTILLTPLAASAPSSLTETNITSVSATLNWEDLNVTSYDIQYGVQGTSTSTWTTTTSVTNSLDISGLTVNTTYDYQVRSVCGATSSSYSSSSTFTTIAVPYCTSSGTTSTTGLTNITFNTINNSDVTNTNSGYEDFTTISTDLTQESSYNLTIYVNNGEYYQGKLRHELDTYTQAWIDWNQDGDFNDVGETYNLGTGSTNNGLTSNSPLSITIPSTARLGATRMRVSTNYENSTFTSCTTAFDGEVEDYTVNIVDSTLSIEDNLLSGFSLYPNPVTNGEITLRMPNEITDFEVTISNVMGQQLFTENVDSISRNNHIVRTSGLKTGIYFVTVSTNLGKATKKMIIQ